MSKIHWVIPSYTEQRSKVMYGEQRLIVTEWFDHDGDGWAPHHGFTIEIEPQWGEDPAPAEAALDALTDDDYKKITTAVQKKWKKT